MLNPLKRLTFLFWCVSALILPMVATAQEPEATARPKAKPSPPAVVRGIASWYRAKKPLVAAHRTYPIGTKLKISARKRSIVVTIAGRGPFIKNRVIDLSSDAFKKLAPLGAGLIEVAIQRLP